MRGAALRPPSLDPAIPQAATSPTLRAAAPVRWRTWRVRRPKPARRSRNSATRTRAPMTCGRAGSSTSPTHPGACCSPSLSRHRSVGPSSWSRAGALAAQAAATGALDPLRCRCGTDLLKRIDAAQRIEDTHGEGSALDLDHPLVQKLIDPPSSISVRRRSLPRNGTAPRSIPKVARTLPRCSHDRPRFDPGSR
jgi:hypothetical protein